LGSQMTFTIPNSGHDFHGNTSYEMVLTATDADNLRSARSVIIVPSKVSLSFATQPAGLRINLNESTLLQTPFTRDSLIGFQHVISAPPTQTLLGQHYAWQNWSDNDAPVHTITTPGGNRAYTATYQLDAPVIRTYHFPSILR
jgi:hypothetical protein